MAISLDDIKKMKKHKRLTHKFGAIRCEREGIKFPSKLERACYDTLKLLEKKGEIRFFLRQPAFDLPGGKKHYVDYCLFTKENVIFVESKGRDTTIGKLKREQVEAIFDIDIFVVKKAEEIYEVIRVNK